MILGVLSDSHGQVKRTAAAVRLLQRMGAKAFVHCGDVGGIEVLEQFAGLPAWVVCGNTDCPDAKLVCQAESLGVRVTPAGPLRFELAGRAIAVFHGHEGAFVRVVRVLSEQGAPPADFGPCDYVLHGHTHVANHARVGPVRVINPGALHRAVAYTVATVDLRADNVQFWELSDGSGAGTPREFRPDE